MCTRSIPGRAIAARVDPDGPMADLPMITWSDCSSGACATCRPGTTLSPAATRRWAARTFKRGFGRSPGCLDVPRGGDRRAGGHHQMSAVSAGAHGVDVRADPSPAGSVGGRAGYEASSNQSSPCGGSRAGATVVGVHGSPSAASTARAKAESTTTAITLRRPPHGHDSTSVANTRRNSSAHGTRPARVEPLGVAAAGGGSLDQVDVGDAPASARSSPSVAAAIAELGVPGATAQELRQVTQASQQRVRILDRPRSPAPGPQVTRGYLTRR